MSLGRHVNYICKQTYYYATSGIALMICSVHCFNHIVLICIVVSYGLTLQKSSLIKLSTSYNSVLRCFLFISKSCNTNNMFASRA